MPTFVVKPNRDDDFYVLWSTVVDAPTGYGTRSELMEDGITPDRIHRANERGTSMIDGDWYGWDKDMFLLMNVNFEGQRDDGAYLVPRDKLKELCLRLGDGRDVGDLLQFEKDQ